MRTSLGHSICSRCRKKKEPVARYAPCTRCGMSVALWSKHRVCWACRHKDELKTPHEGPRKGKRRTKTGVFTTCKMTSCGKTFELDPWQDKRFTWYCPECRCQVAEITTGVLWLGTWGIYLGPEKEILMGSLADAYKEDDHEETIRQADHHKVRLGGGA